MGLLNKILIICAVGIWATVMGWFFFSNEKEKAEPIKNVELVSLHNAGNLYCTGLKGINHGKVAPADILIMSVAPEHFALNQHNMCQQNSINAASIKQLLADDSAALKPHGIEYQLPYKLKNGQQIMIKAEIGNYLKNSNKYFEREFDRLISSCGIIHPSMVTDFVQLEYRDKLECMKVTSQDVFLGIKMENGHMDQLNCSNGAVFKNCKLVTSLQNRKLQINYIPTQNVDELTAIQQYVVDYIKPRMLLDFVEAQSCSGAICSELVNNARK